MLVMIGSVERQGVIETFGPDRVKRWASPINPSKSSKNAKVPPKASEWRHAKLDIDLDGEWKGDFHVAYKLYFKNQNLVRIHYGVDGLLTGTSTLRTNGTRYELAFTTPEGTGTTWKLTIIDEGKIHLDHENDDLRMYITREPSGWFD